MKKFLAKILSGIVLGITIGIFIPATWLVIIVLQRDPNLATAYVALGTLILAAATFLLALFTGMSIREGVQKEKRDKSTRILNEVRVWAEEAAKAAISRQTRVSHELWETKLKYKYSLATSPYVKRVAEPFNSLTPFLADAVVKLEQAIDVTTQVIEGRASPSAGSKLVHCEQELRESIEKLLTEIAATKY